MTKTLAFRPPQWLQQRLDAYAQAHGTSTSDTIIGLFEELIQKTEPGVQSSSGSTVLSPQSTQSPGSPTPVSGVRATVPLGATKKDDYTTYLMDFKNSRSVSTSTAKNLKPGETPGTPQHSRSMTLEERLFYQQEKARIWAEAKIKAEQGIQVAREQVRRYRNTESNKRGSVEWGGADHGQPDFYEYERN